MKSTKLQVNGKQINKLIKAISRKNKEALEIFFNHFGRLIYITAKSVTRSPNLADEVVDDVLFKIWHQANAFPRLKNPNGWLYIITTNCAKDRLKRERSVTEIFDMPETINMEELVADEDQFFHDILFLNETERELMIYRFIEDLSFEMIAITMSKPLSTITSLYYRAIEKLRKNFDFLIR